MSEVAPPSRDQMLDLCRRWQAALGRPDLEALAGLYAETAELESPIAGNHHPGREGVIKATDAFFSAFPDASLTFEGPIVDGQRAAIVADVTGKHVGHFMGMAPTGRPIHFQLVFVLDTRDGLIVRDRRIYDFTGLLLQVGVLKAKPAKS